MLQSRYLTNKDQCLVMLSLTDFYRGPVIEKVRLQGLEHVLQFTAVDDKIFLRSYRYELTRAFYQKHVQYIHVWDGPFSLRLNEWP